MRADACECQAIEVELIAMSRKLHLGSRTLVLEPAEDWSGPGRLQALQCGSLLLLHNGDNIHRHLCNDCTRCGISNWDYDTVAWEPCALGREILWKLRVPVCAGYFLVLDDSFTTDEQ